MPETMTPTLTIRRSAERGIGGHGWLESRHTFSFAQYFDPKHTGYRSLRVINDDVVAPGMGFGAHPHHDMEIFSYVLEGELAHKDSLGNGSTIRAGGLQYMSAGTGVVHSEYNASAKAPVHFLQVWIRPDQKGVAPRYGEKSAEQVGARLDTLTPLFSNHPADAGAVPIHQDARVLLGKLSPAAAIAFQHDSTRGLWLHVIHGTIASLGETFEAGDSAAIDNAGSIVFQAGSQSAEFLLFSLA